MRTTVVFSALLVAVATFAGATEPVATASIEQLQWLAGCWVYVDREAGSGEHWTAPAGGTMLGIGRTVSNGETVSHEFLLIRQSKEGGLEYVAHPSGQASTVFRLEAFEPRHVVFANPKHDFPQRVIYHLRTDAVLAARIEGVVSGEVRRVEFTMEKGDCPG